MRPAPTRPERRRRGSDRATAPTGPPAAPMASATPIREAGHESRRAVTEAHTTHRSRRARDVQQLLTSGGTAGSDRQSEFPCRFALPPGRGAAALPAVSPIAAAVFLQYGEVSPLGPVADGRSDTAPACVVTSVDVAASGLSDGCGKPGLQVMNGDQFHGQSLPFLVAGIRVPLPPITEPIYHRRSHRTPRPSSSTPCVRLPSVPSRYSRSAAPPSSRQATPPSSWQASPAKLKSGSPGHYTDDAARQTEPERRR